MKKEIKRKFMLQKAEVIRPIVEQIRRDAAAGMQRKTLIEKYRLSGSVIANIIHRHTYTYYE